MKTVSAAVVSALLMANASAAGLGKLTVLSSLGQPLRAEIELTAVSKDEIGTLVAKLASQEAFRQANIDFNSSLLSLRFAVEHQGNRQFIRLSSAQPVNEPFVDLLMELSGPNGRLIREYTFLLDPPGMQAAQPAQVAPLVVPNRGAAAAPQPALQAPSAAQSRPSGATPSARGPAQAADTKPAQPVPTPTAENNAGQQEEYKVNAGDTLAKIAHQVRPSSVSLDQMLVALYRTNPDAFIDKNMNRMRAGQILTVPSAAVASRITQAEARSVVLAQSRDFNDYRSKLASQAAAVAAQQSAESRQSAGGKITARVEEPATPANESQDKLQLSKAGAAANSGAERLGAVGAEEKIALQKAAEEANARVRELEKNIHDLQKLLEVKNKMLAEQQNQAEAAPAAEKMPAAAAVTPAAVPAATELPAGAAAAPQASAITEAADAESAMATGSDKVAAAPTASPEESPKPTTSAVPPATETPKPATPVARTPQPESSFINELLDNPLTLPGAGILLAGLGALGIYGVRRRRQQKQFEDSIITDSSLKANSLFGSTGGQSVDTNNSVFNSNFAPSASQLDSNEVDPVAEADVYIAYGRDAQAEEILKEALRTQPDRNSVRVKLLEIYSNRKDTRAFEVLATELYGLTKGEGEDWAQAAALGASIDPENPMYASARSAKAPGFSSGMIATPGARLADTHPHEALDTIGALDADTAYFSNTAVATDASPAVTEQSDAETVIDAARHADADEPVTQPASTSLDFDLEGFQNSIEVPNTIPRPLPAEPADEMASIDFDFLKEPKQTADTPAQEPTTPLVTELSVPEIDMGETITPAMRQEARVAPGTHGDSTDYLAPLNFDLPEVAEAPMSESVTKTEPVADSESLDFNLSGIDLELNPGEKESGSDLLLDTEDTSTTAGELSSSDAEMATKLDLAIAYQEIGDKEGARELLDEVLKGGSVAQSEKARSLLVELA